MLPRHWDALFCLRKTTFVLSLKVPNVSVRASIVLGLYSRFPNRVLRNILKVGLNVVVRKLAWTLRNLCLLV